MTPTMDYDPSHRILSVFIHGELDHHSSITIREKVDIAINKHRPKLLVLDFSHVTFMDSSGIGLVMGRSRVMQENGASLLVANPNDEIKKLMLLAGLDRLIKIVHTAHSAVDNRR